MGHIPHPADPAPASVRNVGLHQLRELGERLLPAEIAHLERNRFRELKPFERIVYMDKFDDPNLPREMVTTVSLKQVSCGTELGVVQDGLPEAIPLEMCYLGWQESLAQLARLVEPEIPD